MNCTDIKKTRRAIWYNENSPLNNYDIWLQKTTDGFVLKVYDNDDWYDIASGGSGGGHVPSQAISWYTILDRPDFATINGISVTQPNQFQVLTTDDDITLKANGFYSSGYKLGDISLLINGTTMSTASIKIKSLDTVDPARDGFPTSTAIYNALLTKQDVLPTGNVNDVFTYTQHGPRWCSPKVENKIHHIQGQTIIFSTVARTSNIILQDGHFYICDDDIITLTIDCLTEFPDGATIKFHTDENEGSEIAVWYGIKDVINLTENTLQHDTNLNKTYITLDRDSDYYVRVIGNGVFVYHVNHAQYTYPHIPSTDHDACYWFATNILNANWKDMVLNSLHRNSIVPLWETLRVFHDQQSGLDYIHNNTLSPDLVNDYPDDENMRWLYILIPDIYDFRIFTQSSSAGLDSVLDRTTSQIMGDIEIDNVRYTLYRYNNLVRTAIIPFLIELSI